MSGRGSHRPSLRTIAKRTLAGALGEGPRSILVAASGGPDSQALLDVVAGLREELGIVVRAHGVDHGLRAAAAGELDLAEALADRLGVEFSRTKLRLERGANLQARARAARYAALREAAAGALVATGHHADDRAETVILPEAARARAAAYIITTTEGASLHLDRLRTRPGDFDPAVRDRFIAGAMVPAVLVDRAQKFRRWYRARVLELFKSVDVILAPATPCVAPKLGQTMFTLDGVELPVRANIGIHTQPISFIGLPMVAVPVPLQPMPIGVQIIAAPWREDIALRVAHALEKMGAVAAPEPRGL